MRRLLPGLALLAAVGCRDDKPVNVPVPTVAATVSYDDPPAEAGTPRYLALGDSYTIGQGEEADGRFPQQLAAALAAKGWRLAPPTVIARTGWSVKQLSEALEASGRTGPYQLVTLLIGVNDQFRGGQAADYREPFAKLLARAIELAGGRPGRVVVVSIPDYGVTPFASAKGRESTAAAIDAFNAVNREESAKAGVHYVDVTPISRKAATDPTLLVADGLHPSRKMYAQWVEVILPAAEKALKFPNQ